MPKIIFNGLSYGSGIGGGGNANFVELTKAEYDALEAAGQVKADTLYLIKDGILGTDAGMGNADISKIGDGTVTGAIKEINSNLEEIEESSFIPKRVLTSADDLNTLYEPGIYSFATNNVPQNSPFSNGSIVEVIYATNARIIQRVTRYGVAGQSAERVLFGTDWLAWVMRCTPVRLSKRVMHTVKASNTYELVTSITIPANCFYVFSVLAEWANAKGLGVFISASDTNYAASAHWSETTINENNHGKAVNAIGETYDGSQTFYIWAKWAGVSTNPLTVSGFYINKV